MKKIAMLLMVLVLMVPCLFADDDLFPFKDSRTLLMEYQLNYEFDPHFIFSDISDIKDGNFEDIFANGSLNKVKLTSLVDGKLYNDNQLYVYWVQESLMPIGKMTIEMPTPLLREDDFLDWYVSVNGDKVLGGKNGYGSENATIIYEKGADDAPLDNTVESVQLKLWTDDIKGKKSGEYNGTLVLRVFGES